VDHRYELTAAEKQALRDYLSRAGHSRACAAIGLARMTVYRARDGEAVYRSTLAAIRSGLALAAELERQS